MFLGERDKMGIEKEDTIDIPDNSRVGISAFMWTPAIYTVHSSTGMYISIWWGYWHRILRDPETKKFWVPIPTRF